MSGMPFYLIFLVLLINAVCFGIIYMGNFFDDKIIPKYISSSLDTNVTVDFDSVILKSLKPLLYKLFPSPTLTTKHVGDLPKGSSNKTISNFTFTNTTSDIMINRTNSYYEMIIKNYTLMLFKKYISYYEPISIASLYEIPINNFLISTREEFDVNKSVLKKKWSVVVEGKLEKLAVSNDRNYICILFSFIQNNSKMFKMKYFNVNNSTDIENIEIDGNIGITSLTVKKDVIAFSRENKEEIFLVEKIDNKWVYKTILSEETNEISYFHHTNSLKFLELSTPDMISFASKIQMPNDTDFQKDFAILQQTISILSSGIYAKSQIDFVSNETIKFNTLIKNKLAGNNLNGKNFTELYNIKKTLKELEKCLKSTIYSTSTNSTEIIFEFLYGILIRTNVLKIQYQVLSDVDYEIDQIASDAENLNIIVKYSTGEIMHYYKSNDVYNDGNEILFTSLPKKYSKKNIITFSVGKFEDKSVLMLLMDNGIVLGMDITSIVDKVNSYFLKKVSFSFLLIFLANALPLLIHFFKRRNRPQNFNIIRLSQLNNNNINNIN